MLIFIYIIFSISICLLWNIIHESSHLLMAHALAGIKNPTMKPYPHKVNGKFYWARASWYYKDEAPSNKKRALISFAPRIPNLIVIALMFLLSPPNLFWLIFCAGGIIDLFVGSLGISEISDLRKAALKLSINPWILRAGGGFVFTLAAIRLLFLV